MLLIDKLSYQSKLRYVNASEKLVYALLTLVLCVLSRSVKVAVLVFAVNGVLTVGKGGIPLFRYIKLLMIPLAFLAAGTAAVMINVSRTPMDAFALPAGEWYITGSCEGIRRGLRLCVTALSAVSSLYFLSLNTVMTDILCACRKLHFPSLLTELMLLIYRFIFVLFETASSITVSQQSRLGNRSFKTRIRSFGKLGASLFILALKRSGALYDAMESRCYDGSIRVLSREQPAKAGEIAVIALYGAVLVLVWLLCG
ncbi:MAG TPA: cobalt ECF transporter T component CbiQ [Candidatus Mediterraneibacter gallistercoris]|uniref:Cobalt ECF transporter T component CbiQ n=1 Tax=Candidatus Mediterraneibacter gallistercoris TaxID=2838671 RepID=A0A9D2P6D6_9FIRM|nr:cobalt ECF transporter T component CbiQ [Candidatus Mediterraneibacter gallistercoris]